MELTKAILRRRMRRSFTQDPIDPEMIEGLLDLARRTPSAGNSQGVDFVLLHGPTETAKYWDTTLPESRRASFAWPGLLEAPVLVVVTTSAAAYLDRYSEADKSHTGLGASPESWQVPFWYVDAGMAIQNMLLAAVDAGIGACFFGLFKHAEAVATVLGIPDSEIPVGTVALGHPSGDDLAGRSAARPRRPLDQVLHRGSW